MLNTFRLTLLGGIAAATASLTSLGAHAASQYTVTEIGKPTGSTYFSPFALNDNGVIAGLANNPAGESNAFLLSGGTFTNLGELASGGGLNNAGTVVGRSATGQAVILRQGTATVLPNLPGTSSSAAVGINQAGTVVGASGTQAVIWKDGQVQALNTGTAQGSSSLASAINDSGVSIGNFSVGNRPSLWRADGTVTTLSEPPVGYEPYAYGLNNAGLVVGVSRGIHSLDPVVWRNGVAEALPRLGNDGGAANAVNDAGLIVGVTYGYSDIYVLATLWQDGQAYDLNTLLVNGQGTYDLADAFDINASGQILASSRWGGSFYLLTPVPEPATYAMFAVGLLSLVLARRKPSPASPPAR